MPRRKAVTPRFNMQTEVPPILAVALDMIADNARGGEGVTRSHLVRSVLTEFVELKLGASWRQAIASHERFGGDVMAEFVKAAMKATNAPIPSVDVPPDLEFTHGPGRREAYEPAPQVEASLTDADPAIEVGPVDPEEYQATRPFEKLPEHFEVRPKAWKPFV